MRTVLVTGANKGIGHEVARQLGSKGFHVFVGARSSEKGETATQALRKNGAVATFISLDVSAPESIRNAVQVVAGTADHLDVLVNNAGVILEGDNSIAQLDPETVTRLSKPTRLGRCLSRRPSCRCFREATHRESSMFPAVEGSWPKAWIRGPPPIASPRLPLTP
ncbi:MAG TPA: SDR family NAD(P)-dependent oxidoreductase [Terrimicrobiaceae bacterium]|nr:SDR family NAD(P)-dependent oxidoreductase [Terrimicrobiaceae bacterium]